MNQYKVKVSHIFGEVFNVEAESKEEAKQKVIELMQKEDFQIQAGYETTFPAEHWKVITEEEFQELVKSFNEQMEKEDSNIITPNIITP
jgi:hypothetical protein